ncbi:MAG: hypothetical protein JXA42_08460 [Anaerolineales bacterium]|nr:hypothetical protein [Anaerolineales bacterium]
MRSMMKRLTIRYSLTIFSLDQLWLPAAFWALFAIISLLRREPSHIYDMTRVYQGVVVPLVAGFMGAYAVLDDPILELRFAAPTTALSFLAERLGLILAIQALSAISFQAFALALGADLSPLGNWIGVQLSWLAPTLSLMGLGCVGSLLAANTMTGAFMTGIVWLIEILARGWLARNAGKFILVFMGALMPDHPALSLNQLCLTLLTVLFLISSWALLRKQERYI